MVGFVLRVDIPLSLARLIHGITVAVVERRHVSYSIGDTRVCLGCNGTDSISMRKPLLGKVMRVFFMLHLRVDQV